MEISERVKYWLDLSDEDIRVAKHLLDGKMFLYCGFMCHLAVEKALKAIIAQDCSDDEIPPKIHHLMRLAEKANILKKLTEEQKSFLGDLNPLHIEARYPEHKNYWATKLTEDYCQSLVEKTEIFSCWIKKQL